MGWRIYLVFKFSVEEVRWTWPLPSSSVAFFFFFFFWAPPCCAPHFSATVCIEIDHFILLYFFSVLPCFLRSVCQKKKRKKWVLRASDKVRWEKGKVQEERREERSWGSGREAKKGTNSMHEENDVSNRHTTWWRNESWIRGQRTTHADGARPSTNMASSQKGSRTGPRLRQCRRDPELSRRGRGGEMEEDEMGARENWKRSKQRPTRCLPLPLPNCKRNKSNSSSSNRSNALAVNGRWWPQVERDFHQGRFSLPRLEREWLLDEVQVRQRVRLPSFARWWDHARDWCDDRDAGKGSASVLRGSGVRVSITNCDPICAVQACVESFQAAFESVVSEPELCGSCIGASLWLSTASATPC